MAATGPLPRLALTQVRVIEALDEALELDPDARTAWLADLAAREPNLAHSLRRMLDHDQEARRLWPTQPVAAAPAPWVRPPERIGPYRLTELLGMGGMGAVWKGERDDGLFEHAVAIKLLRPGLAAAGAAAQFEIERRVLAKLQHPNIAQLFDGGADGEGRAYFVMELVEGAPITQHAYAHGLSPREAGRLLLPVFSAVQHAHQALVVHADIKPGNILVDVEGRPKLLDFGIARNLREAAEQNLGAGFTLAYASPERQSGEGPKPPDDVYALGVVLYELATGLSAEGAVLARASQAARESEDPAIRRRGAQIGPELDAVIAKATAPHVEQRYDSVAAFGEDLRRWIEGYPVRARPPSWRRSLAGLARRHPISLAAGVLAVALLIGAFAAVSSLYIAEGRARAMAEARYADVRGLARYLLFDVYDRLEKTPRALPVRQDVAAVGQRYLDTLAADAAAPQAVRLEAAEGLLRLASIQGGGWGRNLGLTDAARVNLERALAIAQDVTARDPSSADGWRVLARAQLERAILGSDKEGDQAAAEARLMSSRAALDRGLQLRPADPSLQRLDVEWRLQLSALRQWQERFPESIAAGQDAMERLASLPPPLRDSPEMQRLLARAYDAVAETTFYSGDQAGSVEPYRRQLAIFQRLHAADPGDPAGLRALSRAEWALGTTLLSLGRNAEALRYTELAAAHADALIAFDPDDAQAARTLRITRLARAEALIANGRKDEAAEAMAELVEERLRLLQAAPQSAEAHRDYAVGAAALADALVAAGRPQQACARYSAALAEFEVMARRGWLSPFDEGYSRRLAKEGAARVCGRA